MMQTKNISRNRISHWINALLIAGSIFSLPVFGQGAQDGVAVSTSRAQLRDLSPSQWAAGRVVSRRDIRVSSQLDGLLEYVAEPGTQVKQGQRLAELDATPWKLQLRDAESQIKQLQARLTYMDAQLNRLQSLAERNSTSRAVLEEQQAEREALAQQLAAAEIARDRSQYELGKTRINAPFDTLVVSRELQPGEYVRTGDELMRALDMGQLEVEADIPLGALPLLQQGDVLTLRSDVLGNRAQRESAATVVQGQVRQLVPVADTGSRRVKMLVSLPTEVAAGWIAGLPVQVAVPLRAAEQTIAIPRDALILRDGNAYVFRVDGEGKAQRLAVTAGSGDGDWIAVEGDVRDGDQVIVRGAERLQPGQAVKVLREIAVGEAVNTKLRDS
ncbi:efflux RND transporter periplasmic adaptor subunit [Microbulbifer agarilyticus]|uniref:efflux RND transporter periplasmic adaptor subunit n=1 Tax=Microbulbifer agarilyticus TaxID=260552 RepID=UPI001CD2C6CE|nr:efflux RND transporter periplasmic adaptor subunit [Microbulbifer agarilyticus]MCA0899762.1 efflux RND transporter periplasmic adaptor subunit [Microbulbifer agarilyticus]